MKGKKEVTTERRIRKSIIGKPPRLFTEQKMDIKVFGEEFVLNMEIMELVKLNF